MVNLRDEALINNFVAAIDAEQKPPEGELLPEIRDEPGAFQASLSDAHAAATSIYGYAGIEVPTPSGAALDEEQSHRLSNAYELMNVYGLQPEVVVSLDGLDLKTWRQCYGKLADEIHAPTIISGDVGPGVSPTIERHWEELEMGSETAWTVGVVAAAPEAPLRNVSHDLGRLHERLTEQEVKDLQAGYPSLAEYLGLQAARYLARRPPIDVGGLTWLLHTIDDGSKAPLGGALPAIDAARITCAQPQVQDPSLGIRATIRETLAA